MWIKNGQIIAIKSKDRDSPFLDTPCFWCFVFAAFVVGKKGDIPGCVSESRIPSVAFAVKFSTSGLIQKE